MSPRDPRQQSAPWLIPTLTVTDVNQSLAFYENAFGFQTGNCMDDETGSPAYADMLYKGELMIMLMRTGSWGGTSTAPVKSGVEPSVGLYVYCDDVDATYRRATGFGATSVDNPDDMFWGDRVAKVKDPDGHVWAFATKIHEFEPEAEPA